MRKPRAAKFWDRHHWRTVPLEYWASNPLVAAYINRRITGDPATLWLDWLAREFIPQTYPHGLCLACGAGTAEVHATGIDMCQHVDAYDISKTSLTAAAKKAESFGLSSRILYHCSDLNVETFAAGKYDIALSSGGLHHIENLEHLLDQVSTALKEGGLLAFDEYIGPPRLQYTDLQLEIVNRIVEALPDELRTGKLASRPSLERMIASDPSESVRSSDILPLVEERFEVLAKRFYGGTLLAPLFASGVIRPELLMPPADETARVGPQYTDLLKLILAMEESLTPTQELPSDYVVLVARKR